jgi:D-cysteine desulfhydrase
VDELPLLRRFPALAALPRASFGVYPTPVERLALDDGRTLLVKRDDLSGKLIGGNKVRGLEWLLGDIGAGDRVLTVGPRGSTHALITAVYARQLGAQTIVIRWNQEMNPAARSIDARLKLETQAVDAKWVPAAYALAAALRMRRRVRWIPAGGASPPAVLGHVNAALELADQVARGESEPPERVVVPFGTGGTAAGLTLGFRIAGLRTHVVAVRVVPRVIGRFRRVSTLARRAAALIEGVSGEKVPRISRGDVIIEHAYYSGAYGRPLGVDHENERELHATGIRLDDTYSRKAFAAALASPSARTLLWLTFDGRLLAESVP